MKKILFVSFLCLSLLGACISSRSPTHTQRNPKIFNSRNWVAVDQNLYAYRFEVNNLSYHSFLRDKGKVCSPDTTAWDKSLAYAGPLVENYFSHPAFADYPVVNISHACAQAYCDWLTEQYHQQYRRPFAKVQFRLPTEAEWQLAARGGDSANTFPWKTTIPSYLHSPLQDKKGRYRANFLVINQLAISEIDGDSVLVLSPEMQALSQAGADWFTFTAPTKSFQPNELGLFNMGGNVAEMVQEEGISKGGSWRQTAYHLQIDKQKAYAQPRATLGFRPFMEVIIP